MRILCFNPRPNWSEFPPTERLAFDCIQSCTIQKNIIYYLKTHILVFPLPCLRWKNAMFRPSRIFPNLRERSTSGLIGVWEKEIILHVFDFPLRFSAYVNTTHYFTTRASSNDTHGNQGLTLSFHRGILQMLQANLYFSNSAFLCVWEKIGCIFGCEVS